MTDYLIAYWPVLLLTLLYLILCLWIGWYFRQRATSGVSAYYVAKREIPGWVISLAFFSTFASSNTYIGQAGQAFKFGLSWAWVGFFWAIFCVISWLILGPKMRFQTSLLGSNTIPDYFQYRYKSDLAKTIRVLSAFVILFATIWYMVGIAKGSAHVMESVLNIPYNWGAGIIIFITLLYTSWGGMYSVLWTDAVQGIMMFAVAIIMFMLPIIYVGGPDNLMTILEYTTHPDVNGQPIGNGLVSFGVLVSFFYILGIGLAVGMKQIAEPRCLIRFYSVDNAKSNEIRHDLDAGIPRHFPHLCDGAGCTGTRHGHPGRGRLPHQQHRPGGRFHAQQVRQPAGERGCDRWPFCGRYVLAGFGDAHRWNRFR